MLLSQPSVLTKERYSASGLNIRSSIDIDENLIEHVMLRVLDELCPKLTVWYRHNSGVFREQFFGPNGQDLEKRIFYTVEKSDNVIVGSGGLVQKDPAGESAIGELTTIYLLREYRV